MDGYMEITGNDVAMVATMTEANGRPKGISAALIVGEYDRAHHLRVERSLPARPRYAHRHSLET